MTLWLPFIDRGLSYKAWADEITLLIGSPKCVNYFQLDRNQIAGLGFHSNLKFFPLNVSSPSCEWLMVKDKAAEEFKASPAQSLWSLSQTLQRPGDKKDRIYLFQLKSANQYD
jgi:hypothetical protein